MLDDSQPDPNAEAAQPSNSELPKDEPQIDQPSNSEPAKLGSQAPEKVVMPIPSAAKKPRNPARTPEQVAYDNAVAAKKKADEVVEEKRVAWEESKRALVFLAGQKGVHAALLNADRESRITTLSTFIDVAPVNQKQAVIDYLAALNSIPAAPEKGK